MPLYNLHPVSKLLLARRLKERGIERVISGDGADQVFAGVSGWDYLPIVAALFDGAGVALCCPFLHTSVAGWAVDRANPAKSALRDVARQLLPASIADAPKVGQLAPEMNLSDVATAQSVQQANMILGLRQTGSEPDVRRSRWLCSFSTFHASFGDRSCVASRELSITRNRARRTGIASASSAMHCGIVVLTARGFTLVLT